MGWSEKNTCLPPVLPIPPTAMRTRADFHCHVGESGARIQRPLISGSQVRALVRTIQSTETRRGKPACGKAYFRPVFRDREGGSCVSAHRSRLLGRFWGACLRRQKSRSWRQVGRSAPVVDDHFVRQPVRVPLARCCEHDLAGLVIIDADRRLVRPLRSFLARLSPVTKIPFQTRRGKSRARRLRVDGGRQRRAVCSRFFGCHRHGAP
jgi:hypothetical protein